MEPARRCSVLLLGLVCATGWVLARRLEAQGWQWKEGREELVAIVRGNLDEVIGGLEARLARVEDPGEPLFLLAVAQTRRGDLDAAMQRAQEAIASGVPLERFFAGPRELLLPLVESAPFRKLVGDRGPRLLQGPMVGSVTDRSARFWVRTSAESDVRVEVWPSDDPGAVRRIGEARTRAGRDFTTVVGVEGLAAASEHQYVVFVDGESCGAPRTFRTFPAPGVPARFEIVFGGGSAYTPGHESVFRTIAERRPLAFLALGDNVYIDHPETPEAQRYLYYRRQSSPPWRELVGSTCVAAIWDDHDFGTDDCVGGPRIDDPPWKPAVWRVFRENWCNPSYGDGDTAPGCWFAFSIGDVRFFLLDGRYWRERRGSERRSMLGARQKEWLLAELTASKATFNVIASPVPFASGVKPGSLDPWDGFPEEREEIFSWIAEKRVEGVILIAADRHRSDVWHIPRPGAYDLYEFESSRLTNIHTHGVLAGSLFGFNADRSFGVLRFDTEADDPSVSYEIRAASGRRVYSLVIRRSRLGFAEGTR